jgi:hypothetical protein
LSGWPDLNRRPLAPQTSALPDCATARGDRRDPRKRRRSAVDDRGEGRYLTAVRWAKRGGPTDEINVA